jgi:hypothetical protein
LEAESGSFSRSWKVSQARFPSLGKMWRGFSKVWKKRVFGLAKCRADGNMPAFVKTKNLIAEE